MSLLNPEYIVVHTAAYNGTDCDAQVIDKWHRDRGWNGIGYHFVILNDKHNQKADGTIESGRPKTVRGAHARGINSRSLGICCIGHGDHTPFTENQMTSLIRLISDFIDEHDAITVDKVIGHRELNQLVSQGSLSEEYRTTKSCPGKKVSMDQIRQAVSEFRISTPIVAEERPKLPGDEDIRKALSVLQAAGPRFSNARDPLTEFLTHPEVLEFLEN